MSTARIGSVAGGLTLVGILSFEVIGPSLVVGSPVTGSTDRSAIETYYANKALLPFGLGAIAIIIPFIVFVTALREELVRRSAPSFWANAGFGFALVAAAVLLLRSAVQLAIVRGLAAGSDVLPIFFTWDFAYNTAVYAMEAGYPLAFAIAMTAWPGTPRWFLGLAAVVSGWQLVNMTSLVVGLPLVATLPGNVVFAAWFATTVWLLGRQTTMPEPVPHPAVA